MYISFIKNKRKRDRMTYFVCKSSWAIFAFEQKIFWMYNTPMNRKLISKRKKYLSGSEENKTNYT